MVIDFDKVVYPILKECIFYIIDMVRNMDLDFPKENEYTEYPGTEAYYALKRFKSSIISDNSRIKTIAIDVFTISL